MDENIVYVNLEIDGTLFSVNASQEGRDKVVKFTENIIKRQNEHDTLTKRVAELEEALVFAYKTNQVNLEHIKKNVGDAFRFIDVYKSFEATKDKLKLVQERIKEQEDWIAKQALKKGESDE